MESQFLESDYQGFLKDVEVWLIDKTQASDTTKRKLYWMTTLRTFYLDGRNIESDYLGTAEGDFRIFTITGCYLTTRAPLGRQKLFKICLRNEEKLPDIS